MGKGKPTGITFQDLYARDAPGVTYIMFEGERVTVRNYGSNSFPEILELGGGGPDIRLYGHFEGDEFMEEDREFIP